MATKSKTPLGYKVLFAIARLFRYELKIEHQPFTKYPPTIISIRKLYK